jgi:hypothetical protein
MAKATQQEDPEVVAYEQRLIATDVEPMYDSHGCDIETEVWDGQMCVPKSAQTNNG